MTANLCSRPFKASLSKRDKNFNDSNASSTTDERRYASTFAKRFMLLLLFQFVSMLQGSSNNNAVEY